MTSLKYTHTHTHTLTRHGAGYHGNQEPDLFASFRPLTRVKTCSLQPQTETQPQVGGVVVVVGWVGSFRRGPEEGAGGPPGDTCSASLQLA